MQGLSALNRTLKVRQAGALAGMALAAAFLALMLALKPATPVMVEASSLTQTATEGQAIFEQKCKACHTIGAGKLVGPDLQGVTARRDRQWLVEFISGPDKMFAAKDPTALQLLAENNNIQMPNLGLAAAEVDSLLAFFETQTGAGSAPQPAAPQPAAPLPAGDPDRGRQIFTGGLALAGGGTSCIACHTVSGAAALGGGALGPDLTHVVQRYGGQAGMASTLASLPFPTMQGIFAAHPLSPAEQADLLAFLVQADQQPATPVLKQPILWPMWAAGGAGLIVLFGILAIYWPRQRRSMGQILRSEK